MSMTCDYLLSMDGSRSMIMLFMAAESPDTNSNELTTVIYAVTSFCICILTVFFISLVINIYLCTRCKQLSRSSNATSNPVQPIYDTISRPLETSEDRELNITENVAYGQVQLTATQL